MLADPRRGPSPTLAALAYLAVLLPVAACGAEESTRLGYVIAPSVPEGADASDVPFAASLSKETRDAGRGALLSITRPLPAEPSPPRGANGCTRDVSCREEDDEPPAVAFLAPFTRCPEAVDDGGRFSVAETRTARENDPTACCYVTFRACRGPRRMP
jgi:hypothetical protein